MAGHGVTLDEAQRVVQAAHKRAEEIGQPMDVAVVDAGNNLTAFGRMDGAWLGSIDISIGKAHTARDFDLQTKDLASMAQPGQPLYGIESTNNHSLVIFAGGIPLQRDGQIVGAVGVSGGTVDQDQDCAEAGARAL